MVIAVALLAPTSLFLEKNIICPVAYAVTDELAVVDLAFDQVIMRNGHRNRSLACSVGHHGVLLLGHAAVHHHGVLLLGHAAAHHHGTLLLGHAAAHHHGVLLLGHAVAHHHGVLLLGHAAAHHHGVLLLGHAAAHHHGVLLLGHATAHHHAMLLELALVDGNALCDLTLGKFTF